MKKFIKKTTALLLVGLIIFQTDAHNIITKNTSITRIDFINENINNPCSPDEENNGRHTGY